MTRREALVGLAAAWLTIAAGLAWLWGAVGLLVAGVMLAVTVLLLPEMEGRSASVANAARPTRRDQQA